MPLLIVKKNIAKIKCDAIVEQISGVDEGKTIITPVTDLPYKFVISTVAPVWKDGQNNEEQFVKNCYNNCLKIALKNNCNSIAIPLISSGTFKFPKNKVLKIAVKTINKFLQNKELTVYLAVQNKKSYEFSQNLYDKIRRFVKKNYYDSSLSMSLKLPPDLELDECAPIPLYKKEQDGKFETKCLSIETMLGELDDTFAVALLKLIDLKGMTDVECYKKANVSKQTWYKILNEKDYRPSKNTVIAFAISLKLTYLETQRLLSTVGFTLSRSRKFDVIIEYFLTNGVYDIMKINETLFEFDQPCLGV